MERKIEQLNDKVGDIINQLAVKGRNRLIGSNSLRSIKYGADYDAEAYPKDKSCAKLARKMRDAYLKTATNPDVWITDFKAGWDERLVYRGDFSKASVEEYCENPLIPPAYKKKILEASGEEQEKLVDSLWKLRWDTAAIKRGWVKLIDGKKKTFAEAIMDKTPCKIDLIIKVGDQFAELSENYYLTCDGKKNWNENKSQDELEADFEEEIRYYSRVNKFKALKRLFSLLKVEGEKKNQKKLDCLIDFFNSPVGYANKIKNELDILETLLMLPNGPKWELIKDNLQYIKEGFSKLGDVAVKASVFPFIDGITATSSLADVRELRDYLVRLVNRHSADFLADMMD